MVATLYRLSIGHAHYYMGGSNVLPEPEYRFEHENPEIDMEMRDQLGYYNLEPTARFSGSAANYLGIEGEQVTEDDQRVRNLFQGMSPDGEYQLRKMQDRQRTDHLSGEVKTLKARPAYDHVLNAPKTVSIAYALGDEDERAMILFSHQQAVSKVEEYLSERAMTRTGAGGKNQEQVESLFLTVDHDTNRSVEPHLHSHIVQFNYGLRENGKWGAIDANHMFHDHHHIGAIYLKHLRDSLEDHEIPTRTVELKHGTSFELQQVEQHLVDEFSTPSRVAHEHLKEKGIEPTGKAMHIAVLDTHDAKRPVVDRVKVEQGWKQRAEESGGYHPQVVLDRKRENDELEKYKTARQLDREQQQRQFELKYKTVDDFALEQWLQYLEREQAEQAEVKNTDEAKKIAEVKKIAIELQKQKTEPEKQQQAQIGTHRTGQRVGELDHNTGQQTDCPVAKTGQDVPHVQKGRRGILVDATPTRYTIEPDEGITFKARLLYSTIKKEFTPEVKVDRVGSAIEERKALPDRVMTQENYDKQKGEQRAAEAKADHDAGKFSPRQSMAGEVSAGERLVRSTTVGNYVADKYLKYEYGTPKANVRTTGTLTSSLAGDDREKAIVKIDGSDVIRAVDKSKVNRIVTPGESSAQKYTEIKAPGRG